MALPTRLDRPHRRANPNLAIYILLAGPIIRFYSLHCVNLFAWCCPKAKLRSQAAPLFGRGRAPGGSMILK